MKRRDFIALLGGAAATWPLAARAASVEAGNPNWLPGVSGNPGGRSRELAQQQSAARLEAASHASEVIDYLLKVLRSEEEGTAHRLKAGIELLNRGLGLPQAQIDVDMIEHRVTLSEDDIERRLIELAASILDEQAGVVGGVPAIAGGTRSNQGEKEPV